MTSVVENNNLPLTVDNIGFLLDRLGNDCHPLQFLRELTQNSIEAVLRTPERSGEIIWDVDWTTHELEGVYKLCITDTGCGMSGPEMIKYINQLSSSISQQSDDGNYGVGAKIAAATRNHAGLIYLSWKDGVGSMIHMWRDPKTHQYGLRQVERPDGTFGHWAEIDEDIKPELIQSHGTRVILYGHANEADTMKAPPIAASPSAWIAKYLNGRYFSIPDGITIKARQGWEQPRSNTDVNVLRKVTGQRSYLEAHQQSSGRVRLSNAVVHWWILKDEKAIGSNSGYIESSGHVAALYENELYELQSGRSGHSRLQQFGVIYGQRQVVLYVEPEISKDQRITTNTARTAILIDNDVLPWSDWAAEFRSEMPTEISELMESIASKSTKEDHSKSIRERLKNLMDLYKVSRYKPSPTGPLRIEEVKPNAGGSSASGSGGGGGGSGGGTKSGSSGGAVGGVYSVFLKKDGQTGKAVRPDMFPLVKWVSIEDSTRDLGDIEDKAARYLDEQNVLLINADFRVFTDMIDHWLCAYSAEHGEIAGMKQSIQDSVHDWFEQALVETVIGLQALKGSREWSEQDLRSAWSEAALTSVVMQRYHPFNCIKRELGTKIGPLRKGA